MCAPAMGRTHDGRLHRPSSWGPVGCRRNIQRLWLHRGHSLLTSYGKGWSGTARVLGQYTHPFSRYGHSGKSIMKEHERCRASIERIVIYRNGVAHAQVSGAQSVSPVGTTRPCWGAFVHTCPGDCPLCNEVTNLCNHADVGLSQMHNSSSPPAAIKNSRLELTETV